MLVFYCPDNRPGKADGSEFKREATRFAALHDDAIPVALKGTRAQRWAAFRAACEQYAGASFADVVYFGHGTRQGLPGLCSAAQVVEFAEVLSQCIGNGCDIVFNSCLCACGFTQALVVELADLGLDACRATGHTVAGHTTRNPYLSESTAEIGTRPMVRRGTPKWKPWVAWLKEGQNRFKAPWMCDRDIDRALGFEPGEVTTMHDGEILPPDWRSPANIKNQW